MRVGIAIMVAAGCGTTLVMDADGIGPAFLHGKASMAYIVMCILPLMVGKLPRAGSRQGSSTEAFRVSAIQLEFEGATRLAPSAMWL